MPWCSDGLGEAELGGTLEVPMAEWADRCRAQGGSVVIPHLPSPNGEPAALIATGRARCSGDAPARDVHARRVLPLPQLRLQAAVGRRHRQNE